MFFFLSGFSPIGFQSYKMKQPPCIVYVEGLLATRSLWEELLSFLSLVVVVVVAAAAAAAAAAVVVPTHPTHPQVF